MTLVGDALKRLAPAKLDFLRARCRIRHEPPPAHAAPDTATRRTPTGPVDHDVPVLRVSDAQGKLVAVLFGYACHNTTWATT